MKDNRGFLTFLCIWGGQLGSLIGSSLTSFALSVYVFQTTGSVTSFSISLLCMTVPGLIAGPLAGVLVDRWSRKGMMLLSDTLGASAALALAAILYYSHLQIWQVYLCILAASIAGSIQFPAYQAIISKLVEKKHLGRANGLIQAAESATVIAAPPLAGMLLPIIQLKGIILIDFFSFFLAIFSILFVRIPRLPSNEEHDRQKSIFHDMSDGLQYIRRNKGLLWFLVYFAFTNFLLGFQNVLLQPLILLIGTPKYLGFVLSCLGSGMLLGSLVMGAWGGPRKKAKAVLYFGAVSAFFFILMGMAGSILVMSIFLFACFFFLPFGNACSQVIWQSHVEEKVQGRVFALRRMIAVSLMPIAYLLSGPLMHSVFTPFMSLNGWGGRAFGTWLGTEKSGGIRFFFILLGFFWLLLTAALSFKREISFLDYNKKQTKKELTEVSAP